MKLFALCASFALLCLSIGQVRAGPFSKTTAGQVYDLPGQPQFVASADQIESFGTFNVTTLGGSGPPRSRLTVGVNSAVLDSALIFGDGYALRPERGLPSPAHGNAAACLSTLHA